MFMFGFQIYVVSALGTAAAYFIAGMLFLRRRGFSTWLQGVFILYLLLSLVWSVGHALSIWLGLIPQVPQMGWEMAYSAIVILPVVLVVLTILFFERQRAHWPAIAGGLVALLIALVDNNVFGVQIALQRQMGLPSAGAVLHILRWAVWGSFSAGAIVLAVWDYIQTHRPLHRNRIMYWLIASALIILGEGLTLALTAWYVRIGLVTRMAGVLLMTYVLVSYYLPSLRIIVRRSLVAGLVLAITGGAYLLGLWALQFVLAMFTGTLRLIGLGLIALAMAVVAPPLRRRVQELLEKIVLGGRYDPARALREYSAAISNILDLDLLVTVAIGIISEAMETKRGALLLTTEREDGTIEVKVSPGMGEVQVSTVSLSPFSPILSHLQGGQPLTQYEVDILPEFRSAPAPERKWLQDMEMELYVPIRRQAVLLGIIALGDRAGSAPYLRPDLAVLSTLADQTTVALQNARLVADLRALNEQMTRLNEELRDINRRLEKMDAAKTDFIQIASHELRTPITQARGYADILGDMVQTGTMNTTQLLKISQGISRSTQRLEEIITAMLDVSQIDVQALNLSRAPLAMTTIIRMALDPYRDGLSQRKQVLSQEGLEGLPPLWGDLQRLCQAFGNIIVNCIKYTPDGGQILISGRSYQTMDNDGTKHPFIEIVIADTGIGIDPGDRELIFEKFYRVGSPSLHSTGTTKFMGAGPGLGLPIARGIILAHGGRVWVESEARDEQRCPGSQFHVVLPAASLDQPDDQPER